MAWSYQDFKVGSATSAADKKRKELESQKPSDFQYADYVESDSVTQAKNQLNSLQKPGAYQSQWQQSIDDTLNKILNREKFSYDVNGDALYQQYKDQYTTQGKMAMMDTMGQAAAATGGYGNSYAQSVGQQAYQGYLQQLNDKVPELYQLALNQYNREGEDLYNQYSLFADRENTDYGRHRDSVADYNTERGYYTDLYNAERQWDYGLYSDAYKRAYGQHRDNVSDWQYGLNRADNEYNTLYGRDYDQYSDNRSLAYNEHRNSIADDQWKKKFDEAQRQFDLKHPTTGGNGGGNNGGNNGGGDDTKPPIDDTKPPKTPSYSSIFDDCNAFIAAGASRSEISNYIRSAYKDGYITKAGFDDLKKRFVPSSSGGHYTY